MKYRRLVSDQTGPCLQTYREPKRYCVRLVVVSRYPAGVDKKTPGDGSCVSNHPSNTLTRGFCYESGMDNAIRTSVKKQRKVAVVATALSTLRFSTTTRATVVN
jgi:hypothetical protein